MIRSIMASGMLCDPNDPEEMDKLSALRDLGIDVISGFLTISRPYALAPWYRVGGKYDFSQHDEVYWGHLETLAARCEKVGLGIVFQIINKWWIYEGGYPSSVVNNYPTVPLSGIMRRWLERLVPIVNSLKLAAILPVTEGGRASQPMHAWIKRECIFARISPFVHFISNAGFDIPGWVESPHLHSVAAWTKGKITFGSTDGWAPSADEWRKCVQFQKAKGAAAIEYWSPWLSSGAGEVAYADRIRPTMSVIVRECGAQLKATGGRGREGK